MAKNNKTRFFYVLYSDKTRVFDQSERAYYPIYIINKYIIDQERGQDGWIKHSMNCTSTNLIMANNFIQSAAVIVDAYLVSGKHGGRIIYQNSTWRTT